jgi:type I restriction-modification system DNA methylase subunit
MLVEDSLIAVVSLPTGCFNPYSGVKTSILMLDKGLVKKSKHILFIKITDDGFDLGAQRREHDKNDLPLAIEVFNAYKESISSGKSFDEEKLEETLKSLKEWFKEKWVDISTPKAGGGFEPCGRDDANTGKYPKCVPASRAARMTPEQIASAVRRKRTAESTQNRDGKKPINVSTDIGKIEKANVPTDPALYARVKAEAKAKFDVYPSAYANAWLVREYKKRGGGYRVTVWNLSRQ